MNLLTDALPNAVTISGVVVPIYTGFRNSLRTIMAFEDNEVAMNEKQIIMLRNLYPEVPENIEEAFKQGLKFLDGGKERNGEGLKTPMRLFSFAKDAGFIYSAFRQTHGIDLETEDLHWWKFLALFQDLGADTVFCNLTALRKRDKMGKTTKEEKEAIADMGDIFAIEDTVDPETNMLNDRFLQTLGRGKS